MIGRQPIADWSPTGRRLKTVSGLSATAAAGRRSVANQSATYRQPVGNRQKPFYDRFGRREVSLAANKTSLRQNRPCNLLQPVGDQSPTSLQPPCNLPATTRNFGRKEVADRLRAVCDRGFRNHLNKILEETVGMLTHWGRDKMAAKYLTTFSNAFSWMKMYQFWLRFHWSLLSRVQFNGPINNIPTLVQIMAWHHTGDKPLS